MEPWPKSNYEGQNHGWHTHGKKKHVTSLWKWLGMKTTPRDCESCAFGWVLRISVGPGITRRFNVPLVALRQGLHLCIQGHCRAARMTPAALATEAVKWQVWSVVKILIHSTVECTYVPMTEWLNRLQIDANEIDQNWTEKWPHSPHWLLTVSWLEAAGTGKWTYVDFMTLLICGKHPW